MPKSTAVPQYLQIARDLARRIAGSELAEGARLSGRSTMSSEYSVSPETIRRAVRLLADMQVVEVLPQKGVLVLSAENARRYMRTSQDTVDTRALLQKLQELTVQNTTLQQQFLETAMALLKRPGLPVADPLPNYEIPVPENSCLQNRSLGELKFWQATGCTVVAIRRGEEIILSPGPHAAVQGGDILVLVGTPDAVDVARHLATMPLSTSGADTDTQASPEN